MKQTSTLTREDLIGIGFKEMPHFTVTNMLLYDLGRDRALSIGCLGTPNEMVVIQQTCPGPMNSNTIDVMELVILRNYDYNGYTTIEDIKSIITGITGRRFEIDEALLDHHE